MDLEVGGHPIGRRQAHGLVDDGVDERVVGVARLLVREHGDAQLELGHHEHARDVARQPAGVVDDLLAAVVVDAQAQRVAVEVHALGGQLRRGRPDGDGRDDGRQLAHGPLRDQPGPVGQLALLEVDEHPLGHVLGARQDAAGGVHVVVLVDGLGHGDRVEVGVGDGHVEPGDVARVARPARGHADPLQDALGHEVLPGPAADGLDELARRHVEDVVVGVGAAEARRQGDLAETLDDLAAPVGRLGEEEQVPGPEAEPAPVDEEVAHGQLARDVGVGELEPAQVARDRGVPLELALLDEQGQGRGREDLGVRGDAEERPGVDGRRLAELADAVALGQDDPAVLDHGDAHARDAEGLERLGDEGVEAGRQHGGGLGRNGVRGRRAGEDHRNSERDKGSCFFHGDGMVDRGRAAVNLKWGT